MEFLNSLFAIALTCFVPVTLCIILRRKFNAEIFPLLVGIFSYMVLISLPRGAFRVVVLNDGIKRIPWLYYFLSAVISGVFEEVGRYIVFRHIIPKREKWTDCVMYGIGHGAAEDFLTHNIFENDIGDAIVDSYMFAIGIAFSVSMTILVFSAVHHSDDKKLLYTAIVIHTIADIFGSVYFLGFVTAGEFMLVDTLITVVICAFSYLVYRNIRRNEL